MSDRRVMCVFGTRPEAIKMAPVVFALREAAGLEPVSVVTAQHRGLLDDVLVAFGIPPDIDLDLMRPNQTLAALTSRIVLSIDETLDRVQPDLVLAQGDTTTVMATALACFYRRVPFGHVEAGLRTGNRTMPFPEEINRVIAGRLADLHFAPTQRARANLLAEGVLDGEILVTGNTVIDALLHVADAELPLPISLRRDERLLLLTAHRRESFGSPLREVFLAVRSLVEHNLDLRVLFPVHPNPAVEQAAAEVLRGHERVHLVAPLDYPTFVSAMKRSTVILTDSGGVQEEAPALARPVLVLRDETERPEAVDAGVVKLVGPHAAPLQTWTQRLLDEPELYASMATGASPYGDGQAAGRIVARLADFFAQA
jgi:UDP-N-acetylglucosamine 2-epimerase (non-hydrolysing)